MFTIGAKRNRIESDSYHAAFSDDGNMTDVIDNKPNPFEVLAGKEDNPDNKNQNAIDAISSLITYLTEDLKPLRIAARVFLLAYVFRPETIYSMSLQQIGDILGYTKQNISVMLNHQDKIFKYKGRNRPTEEQKANLQDIQKKKWLKKIANNPDAYKKKKKSAITEDMKAYQKIYQAKYRAAKKQLLNKINNECI